ncbi:hypothetical protein WA026_008134 [Henosepilachna vigintioctopunctata]|uniref:Carbohydrate kinase PfkB domain-containing protein n=1 Tax=Henosepilachna vigintioctopunctata TaxID=420089 RepID=A0AAW1TR85_9CUCU
MHPSKFSYIAGGVARNIFEALTKMNASPTLITAIGDDEPGKILKSVMPNKLLNKMKIIKGQNTGQCIIVLNSKGDCSCLLADFGITEQIRPEMIMQNKEEILRARMIVLDANLNIICIEEILKTAMENNIPGKESD